MKLMKLLLRLILRLAYRVEVQGLDHFAQAGKRVLVVANHTSFLDAVLLGAFLPERVTFAINTHIAQRWWIRPLLWIVDVFPMDPANPFAVKSMIKFVKQDRKAAIFPEGRITVTGSLMKIYPGPALVADRSGAVILPVRIDGAQFSKFSRMRGKLRLHWFPKITLTVMPPTRLQVPDEVRGRARREYAGRELTEIMKRTLFLTSRYRRTLVDAMLEAAKLHGRQHIVAEDIERKPHTFGQILTRAFIAGDLIRDDTRPGEYLGLMLPNTVGTMITFLGMQLHGRVPAMLNYTLGAQGMINACRAANVGKVYTSRRFIEAARLQEAVAMLGEQVELIYVEDLRGRAGLRKRLKGLLAARLPGLFYRFYVRDRDPDGPAVVLFTSGSEGAPKGVVLSHANLLANREQMLGCVDFGAQDVILNALPLFHSFGLMAGSLLPLISGMRVFFYPSPLHYRIVPEMAYDINATIIMGTNTFLAGYARFAHPYDFYSVRHVIAGAEKLQESTRRTWFDKFGLRILEGYGATETSPAIAANGPMDYRPGSVGKLLQGMEYYLDPVPGVESGGRLCVRGPNVMLGYLRIEQPGVLQPPGTARGAGWYDTGDIVEIDAQGYVTIRDRARRFAKIGGEMISLGYVEDIIGQVWPESEHAVVTLPDARKGEQIVLVTEQAGADRQALKTLAREQGVAEINLPRRIVYRKRLPRLGSGKIDYGAVRREAESAA